MMALPYNCERQRWLLEVKIAVEHRLLDAIAVASSFLDLLSFQNTMSYPLPDRICIHTQEACDLWDSVGYLLHMRINVLGAAV